MISNQLSALASDLPLRFRAVISSLKVGLDQLYSPVYPQVLTHGDLCQLTILLMPETGSISGIVDWAEASILPFGMVLYGLDSFLGNMGSGGWRYDESREILEEKFWRLFWNAADIEGVGLKDQLEETVRMARDIGVFLKYGFA